MTSFTEQFPDAPMSILQYYPTVREYMEKHCLNKQRVRSAIIFHRNQEGYLQAQDLMDYLGLE